MERTSMISRNKEDGATAMTQHDVWLVGRLIGHEKMTSQWGQEILTQTKQTLNNHITKY